jgi:hypothetical protein
METNVVQVQLIIVQEEFLARNKVLTVETIKESRWHNIAEDFNLFRITYVTFFFFLLFFQKQTLFYMCILGLKFNQVHIITILLLTIFCWYGV